MDEVEQILYHVPSEDKMKLLLGILEREKPESAIVFCNTKRYTEIVAKRLRLNGIPCEFIIGDLPQVKRLRIIDDVKAGVVKYLVATDVAARGLDIEDLALVVNYDLPVESENYVHRIGRTARAGKTGKAVTLASEQDVYELPDIEKYIGKKITPEIASPELYAEDKSQGMRIRTDRYDDRPDSGRRSDSGRPSGSGGRWGKSGGPRREGREGGQAPRRGDGRRRDGQRGRRNEEAGGREEKPAGRGYRQDGENRPAGGNRQAANQELSHLSFDERMAYYKQKYETKGHEPVKGHPKAPPRDRKKKAPYQGDRRDQPRPSGPAEKAEPRTVAAEGKKGLIDRFLGIFKKGPGSKQT